MLDHYSMNGLATYWLTVFLFWAVIIGLSRVFIHFRKLKVQSRKFEWAILRHELMWSALNITVVIFVLKYVLTLLIDKGYLTIDTSPAGWYVVLFEFLLYFFIFDLYFYLVHRLIHIGPLYTWIHKLHHRSTTPNPLTSSSMSPIEGATEALITPVFLSVFTVHEASLVLILPFAMIMGLYVHCGYEIAPRWWYKSWASKWFITPMFHDQHHQYFVYNYGGFSPIWDWVFGTARPGFAEEFAKLKNRKVDMLQKSGLA